MKKALNLFDDIFGSTLKAIYFSAGGDYCKIETDKQSYYMDTEGDCCSNTYFAEVIGKPEGGVLESENIDMPELPVGHPDKDDELVQCYGIEIKTTKGVVTIVYRNSSNGYYGGSSSIMDHEPKNVKWIEQTGI